MVKVQNGVCRNIAEDFDRLGKAHELFSLMGLKSLDVATPLAFSAPADEFPRNDLRKIVHGGQWIAKVQKQRRNIAKNFNRLSRVHERYRRQTDGFAIVITQT